MKKSKLFTLSIFLFLLLVTSITYANPIEVKLVTIEEYKANADHTTLLDVRSVNSRTKSNQAIPGEIWINPYSGNILQNFITSADKNVSYTIFCSCVDDNYSIRAAQILLKNEFKNVTVLKGGWDKLTKSGIKMISIDGGTQK